MRTTLTRLVAMCRRLAHERALDDEVRTHLDLLAADYERDGLSPEEARFAARRAFGGVEQMKERYRDRRGLPWIDDAVRDARYALRLIARAPGFTAVAVLSLAIGIGANVALFSAVYEHVFRKLPSPHADQIVTFRWIGVQDVSNMWSGYTHIASASDEQWAGSSFSLATVEAFRDANRTLTDLVVFAPAGGLNLFTGDQAEFATGAFVSGNFHEVLGVRPLAGRTLTPGDEREETPPVAVITERYWRRRFSAAPEVVGRVVLLNNVPTTIVGVVSGDLGDLTNRGFLEPPDFAIPLGMEPRLLGAASMLRNPADWWLIVMARLRPGVTAQQAEANFAPVFQRAVRDGWISHVAALPPEQRARPSILQRGNQVPRLQVVGAAHGLSDIDSASVRQFSMVGVIFAIGLAIVCVNLANLLLARAAAREREIAMRLAAGATRSRIVRQLLVECTVMGALGGLVGWPVAALIRGVGPFVLAPSMAADWPVIVFTVAASVLSSLLMGLAPVSRVWRARAGIARAAATATASTRIGKSLIVAQVSLTIVLLVGASLLTRTVINLRGVPVGFDAANLVLFTVEPARSGYDRAGASLLYERIEAQVRQLPGVGFVSIAGAGSGLLWGSDSNGNVFLEGRAPVAGTRPEAKFQFVDPAFFHTMGIPLRQGRTFTAADTATAPLVAVVNEAFARAFFGGASALGQRFAQQVDAPQSRLIEIVGIVNDVRVTSLRNEAPPMFYRPVSQTGSPSRTVIVRTTESAEPLMPAIASVMRTIDPRLPLRDLRTQESRIEEYMTEERLLASAAGVFGVIALAVSMIGLFGLMSYAVTRRTRELGIRLAVGARPGDVLGGVMRETLGIVAVGVLIGVFLAAVAAQWLDRVVYGLSPTDPISLALAVVVMVAVALAASYGPARRASRVNPVIALRSE
jgi:predicted permease